MKLNTRIQNLLLEIICYLYILLFVYAAVSKLIDFENFQTQLGQSPILSAHAKIISYLVILIELLLSVVLTIPKYRIYSLYLSVGLMITFTTLPSSPNIKGVYLLRILLLRLLLLIIFVFFIFIILLRVNHHRIDH